MSQGDAYGQKSDKQDKYIWKHHLFYYSNSFYKYWNEIYLCSNELDAVTFHNESITDEQIEEICGEDGEISVDQYKKAETLTNGSLTVSGFSINTELNPTVTYTVKRDGVLLANPTNHVYSETGKYEIELTSKVGDTKEVSLC